MFVHMMIFPPTLHCVVYHCWLSYLLFREHLIKISAAPVVNNFYSSNEMFNFYILKKKNIQPHSSPSFHVCMFFKLMLFSASEKVKAPLKGQRMAVLAHAGTCVSFH